MVYSADQRGVRESAAARSDSACGTEAPRSAASAGGAAAGPETSRGGLGWGPGLWGGCLAPTLHTAGCNYASAFGWAAPPLCCHTAPFPPVNLPTKDSA